MAHGKGSRAVFLDRDGVVNEVVFRDGKPASPRTVEEFLFCEGIGDALAQLVRAGFRLFIVSNQPDVARGFLASTALHEMTGRILARLPVERVLTCVHDDAEECVCRKPRPGMLHEVAASEGIDLSRSYIIGDSWKDIEAGRNAGCVTILLQRTYNRGVTADYLAQDLFQAVELILGEFIYGTSHGLIRHPISR